MVNLRIRLITEIGKVRVCLDGKPLKFKEATSSLDLAGGKSYSLTWFLQGKKGQNYCLEIVCPASTAGTWKRVLDGTGKEGGQAWVDL